MNTKSITAIKAIVDFKLDVKTSIKLFKSHVSEGGHVTTDMFLANAMLKEQTAKKAQRHFSSKESFARAVTSFQLKLEKLELHLLFKNSMPAFNNLNSSNIVGCDVDFKKSLEVFLGEEITIQNIRYLKPCFNHRLNCYVTDLVC